MSKFLTKEQADWLINEITTTVPKSIDGNVNAYQGNEMGRIMQIVRQCTEKEFPELHMRPKHVDDDEELKIYETDCDNAGQKCIVVFSHEEHTHMDRKQFREFAQKINKIVEYLDETN